MRFRKQLIVGHALLLLVTMLTGTIAIIALHVTRDRLTRVTREVASDVIEVQRLQFQAERVIAASRGYLLGGDPESLDRFDDAVSRVEHSLVDLERRGDDFREDMIAIEQATHAYVAAARGAAALRSGTADPRAVVPVFEQTLVPARDKFEAVLTRFVQSEKLAFEHASLAASDVASRSVTALVATTFLGILLATSLALVSIRRLSTQYADVCEKTAVARRAVAARDELIAIVSHDLRSPLTAITLGANALAAKSTSATREVQLIQRASEHMEHLIRQLLDVAKLESGTLDLDVEVHGVESLFESVRALFEARASRANVELTVNEATSLHVLADRERCLQVLTNLVTNAIKFTPPGGRVIVDATTDERDIRFTVTDTGPGIPATDVPHLFERQWQGRRRSPGSLGLGLYICKQIVEGHGGRLGVETVAGRGSTFWFTLRSAAAPSTTTG